MTEGEKRCFRQEEKSKWTSEERRALTTCLHMRVPQNITTNMRGTLAHSREGLAKHGEEAQCAHFKSVGWQHLLILKQEWEYPSTGGPIINHSNLPIPFHIWKHNKLHVPNCSDALITFTIFKIFTLC
ncbi:hypothetical protein SLA2020_051500 [Shorea laevis]